MLLNLQPKPRSPEYRKEKRAEKKAKTAGDSAMQSAVGGIVPPGAGEPSVEICNAGEILPGTKS